MMWTRLAALIRSRPVQTAGVLGGLVLVLLIILVAVLVVSGEADGDSSEDASPETTGPSQVPTVADPDVSQTTTAGGQTDGPNSVERNPLTGQPLASPSGAQIVAVRIDNSPAGRPQIGLDQAEMLIEVPVEGGLTRLTAMYFENRPQLVGPVRSLRPVDSDLLAPFDPLLVTTGGQDFVYRELRGAGVAVLDPSNPDAFQSVERPMPVQIMATMSAVIGHADGGAPGVAPLIFDTDWQASTKAEVVRIPFSATTEVEYRFEDGRYSRHQSGERFEVLPELDREPVPLVVDTVVVQFVAQRSAGYTDSNGADVPTFDVIGFGRVLVFHNGQLVQGSWQRASQLDRTVLTDAKGDPLDLPIGVIAWTIVPRTLDVTFE